MTRQETISREEAVRTISRISGSSVSYAEDLYDSFFPKPVVPQYVADWIDACKENLAIGLYTAMNPDFLKQWNKSDELIRWIKKARNQDIFARAWVDGYEVEKEARYKVKIKGRLGQYLGKYYLNNEELTPQFTRTQYSEGSDFTRTELELTGFGWVFDCPGVEVKEVDDGND